MSYSFMTSSWGAKNGLLNQSKAEQFGLDINTRGNSSTIIGYSVPFSLAGESNTIIGYEAALFAPSGNDLLILGTHAGMSNRADANIFIGNRAGQFSKNGFNLIYIGHDSGQSNDDNVSDVYGSIHVGHSSGRKSIGTENVFIGHSNNATNFTLRSQRNVSIGPYNLSLGSNNVQIGYSNFNAGEFNTTIGYMVENSNNNNSIVIGRNIKNYGSNSVILKTNQLGTYENFKHNLINIQDVIVGSNTATGGYVLKFQTDRISLETSDGNTITLGGNSNSVVAQYYSITAQQFDINANTTFSLGTTFNGRVTTNDAFIANGPATFNDTVLFTAPVLTITSAVNLMSNVNIRGILDVTEESYFKDVSYFTDRVIVSGNSTFCNDINAKNNVIVDGSLFVKNGTGTFCNNILVKGVATFDGVVNMTNDVIFAEDVQVSRNLAVYGNQNVSCNLDVEGTFVVEGIATHQSDLYANGNAFFQKNVNVDCNLSVDGAFSALTATVGNLTITNPTFSLSNNLQVGGISDFRNTANFSCNAVFKKNATFESNVYVLSQLDAYGQVNLVGSTTLASNTFVRDNFVSTATSTFCNDTTFKGVSKYEGQVLLSNITQTYGPTTFYGVAAFSNDTHANSFSVNDFTSCNLARFNGSTILSSNTVVRDNFTSTAIATFCNATSFKSTVLMEGPITMSNNVSIYGPTTFFSAVNVPFVEASDMNLKSLVVSCNTVLDGFTRIRNPLVVEGETTFSNTITSKGVLNQDGVLNLSNNLLVYGTSSFISTINASGIVSSNIITNALTVNSNTTLDGNVRIRGPVVFENAATFCNSGLFLGDVDFSNDVRLLDNVYGRTVSVSNLTISENTSLNGSVLQAGTYTNTANSTFCNTVKFMNAVSFCNTTGFAGAVSMNDNLDVFGVATFHGSLKAEVVEVVNITDYQLESSNIIVKTIVVDSNSLLKGNTTIQDIFNVTAATTFSNTVNHLGKVTISNDIDIYGTARLLGNVSLSNLSACNLNAVSLNVSSNAVLDGFLRVRGQTAMEGSVSFCNNATFNNNTTFVGQSTFSNEVVFYDDVGTKNLNVGSNLFVVNNVEIGKDLDVFGMSTFNNDVFFQDNILVQGRTTLSNIVESYGPMTIRGPLEIAGSNLLVSGSNLNAFVQSIVGSSISSAGNASFSNLQIADGVTFLNSNNIIVGGCNLLYYLNKVESLTSGGGGSGSNNSNVSSPNINASNITTSNIATQNITSSNVNALTISASNAVFPSLNSTNINTFAMVASNINTSGIISSNITAFSINTSNINIASAINTSNITAFSVSSSNIISQQHQALNINASNIEISSNLTSVRGSFSNLSASNLSVDSISVSNAFFNSMTSCNLQVLGNSTFSGNSNIFMGDVVINSNLSVLGTQTFSNLAVNGTASFCNLVYAKESNIVVSDCNLSLYLAKVRELADIINFDDSNILALSNDIIANANTVLMDDVHIESNLYIGGNIIVNGLTCMNNVKLTSISLFNGLDCTGVATFRAAVAMHEDATLCNDLFIAGETSMAGNLLVSGQSFLNRALVQTNLQVGCNLTVGSNLTVAGNLNVTGGLNLSSNVIINGSLGVVRNTNLLSNLNVTGTSTFSSNVIVNTLLTSSNILAMSNLSVLGTTNFNGEVSLSNKLRFPKGSNDWFIFAESNSMNLYQTDLVFQSQGNTRVVFSEDFQTATFNFTGSHRCTWCNCENDSNEFDRDMIGKIVVSMGEYDNLDNSSFIDIDEAVPIVSLARESCQKSVFGVIAGFEERNSDNRFFKIGNMCFTRKKRQENRKVIVNAVGEGGIWVCNKNGDIKNGDLITTCEIEGLGMKQNDDIVRSFTVAKITCDCEFDLNSKMYRCEKVEHEGISYKKAFVGCIYKF